MVNLLSRFFVRSPNRWWVTVFSLAVLLIGCNRDEVTVHRVAKQEPPPAQSASPSPGQMPPSGMVSPHDMSAMSLPQIEYRLPAGWTERPASQMRAASFAVAGNEGQTADVSVIPLPGLGGRELENVNRWRGQVGLPPITPAELGSQAEKVEIAGESASLFDLTGTAEGSSKKARILAAMLDHNGMTWFFKMIGDDALVAAQKTAFVEFLKSVAFKPAMPSSHPPIAGGALPAGHPAISTMPAAATVASSEGKPSWQVPDGWKEVPGGQFLAAKFMIGGDGSAQAAVNVSTSAGDGGGLVANVTRWRGQLGLPPATEEDLSKQITSVDVPGGKAMLVDMTGTDPGTGKSARLAGAVVQQAGQTWFYKLMGDEQVVGQQKEAFVKFIQSANYANAH
jgi:hypothetical protein